MTAWKPVYFNGKFYGGGLNGVHRVSDRLIRECDALLCARPPAERPEATLFAPASSDWVPQLSAIRVVRVPRAGLAWEQFVLPMRSAGGVLVNLANVAPLLKRDKITMIHDVQFAFRDCGYSLRQRFGYRVLVPLIGGSSRTVVTVSDYSRRMLDIFRVAREDGTCVVHNGADHILEAREDPQYRRALGLEDQRYVVMFGSPKPYKNNKVVFDTFANGDGAPLRLVVVGASERSLREAGLCPPPDTVFTGPIGDAQLRSLLAGALALAFPSRTEGFGLPPVEAMLCGCPVVAAPAGAIPEICADAIGYARVDSPEEWRLAFHTLANDEALRRSRIAAGLERAQAFTWLAAGRSLLGIIDRLSSSPARETIERRAVQIPFLA